MNINKTYLRGCAFQLNERIAFKKPQSILALKRVIWEDTPLNYTFKIKDVYFRGCLQGVKVILKRGKNQVTIPKGKVYSIFK